MNQNIEALFANVNRSFIAYLYSFVGYDDFVLSQRCWRNYMFL